MRLTSLLVLLLSVTATAPDRDQRPGANGAAAVVDTSKWTTYRNEKYGFGVKHPKEWSVHLSSGTGPDMISLDGPARGTERPTLHLAIQPNQNPRRRSIDEWFADQLHAQAPAPASTGRITIGGQAAAFMENTNSFGKRRDTFTLLHETDVLSLSYSPNPEYDPIYAAIVATFQMAQ